jgi:hypothetical protein
MAGWTGAASGSLVTGLPVSICSGVSCSGRLPQARLWTTHGTTL